MTDARIRPHCRDREQCERWWRAAQVWIVKNSAFKIQIATDAFIETYQGPAIAPGQWSFTAVRSPHLNGGDEILLQPYCASYRGCAPVLEVVMADFNRWVLGVR